MAGHIAVACLEEALSHVEEEIKAAERALSDRRGAVAQTEKHLVGFRTVRENLAAALEMVKKRVAL